MDIVEAIVLLLLQLLLVSLNYRKIGLFLSRLLRSEWNDS